MFKKTLVASALALAAFGAQAVVVTVPGATTVSQEGSAGAASITLPNVTSTLAAEYTANDTITFTVSGAEFDTTLSNPAAAFTAAGLDTATLGLLSTTATTVTFRITALTDAGADGVVFDGGTFVLSGMVLKTSTVTDAAGAIKVAYSALTNNNQVIDNAGTLSATALTVVSQLTASVTKSLNGIIDVENDRQQFTAGDDSTLTDVLIVSPDEAVAAVNDVTYTGATIVVEGNFGWMETDGDAGIDAAELTAGLTVTGTTDTYAAAINAAGDAITVTVTEVGGSTPEDATFTFKNLGLGEDNAVLSVQDFTVSTTIKYNTAAAAPATKAVLTDADAGSWTLNGAQALFNYVPVGFAGVQNTIVLSNKGIKDGGVVIEGFDEAGNTYGPVTLPSTLDGGTNMSMSSAQLQTWLSIPASTKVSVTVTVNAPDSDVDFSGYTQKAGTGRQLMAVTYL